MPGSVVTAPVGGPPGLTLKAWALVDGGGATLIKGFNISAVNRSANGTFTVTLTAGVNTAANCYLDMRGAIALQTAGPIALSGWMASNTVANVFTYNNAALTNMNFYLAVYE